MPLACPAAIRLSDDRGVKKNIEAGKIYFIGVSRSLCNKSQSGLHRTNDYTDMSADLASGGPNENRAVHFDAAQRAATRELLRCAQPSPQSMTAKAQLFLWYCGPCFY